MLAKITHFLYNFFIHSAILAAWVGGFFSKKIKNWHQSSANFSPKTASLSVAKSEIINRKSKIIWMHCASLGEFEQGRSVLEAFRAARPDWKIALTFFSASGFEVRKNWAGADWVGYLPADSPKNARNFQAWLQPDLAVFVKYEFWPNHLFELKKNKVPTVLISAIFREKQPFFHVFGSFWREMLGCFTHFFVQNVASERLLKSVGFENLTVAGDTRIDRVLGIAQEAQTISEVELFLGKEKNVLICGSTWPADEWLLIAFFNNKKAADFPQKIIVAPHEIDEKHIEQVEKLFQNKAIRFSEMVENKTAFSEKIKPNSLIINNIGRLSAMYQYGRVAFIGGGFGAGIHNTLEPAAFGLPVIFGPNFVKFEEAQQLVSAGGFFVVRDEMELAQVLKRLENPLFYEKTSSIVHGFLEKNRGATGRILDFLLEK
jgi:3-deoxy-D-manno-octulosonic-acid transferase